MKIIVIGTVKFTLDMLDLMSKNDVDLVGVITGLDAGSNSDYANLVPFCEKKKVSCYVTSNINSEETIGWIKSKNADVIFCLGWSRLIKTQLLGATPIGVIGYHPSELPQNRGRHPLVWALVLGLEKTASTFFFMDEGADSGDILSQVDMAISLDDNAMTLYSNMVKTAGKQIQLMIPALENGTYNRIPQDHNLANNWRKRGLEDGKIDWRMSAQSIHNLIRGLSHPYVGAHFVHKGFDYKVWKSKVINNDNICNVEPGKVLKANSKLMIIKCGEKSLELLEVDPMPNVLAGAYL